MKLGIFLFYIIAFVYFEKAPADQIEDAFIKVYDEAHWGRNEDGSGNSGPGSSPQNTQTYRIFLQKFLKENNIKSVVDLGCGDWQFSRLMNWDGIHYIGIDVVLSVIQNNQILYGTDNIQFAHANGTTVDLPEADLFLCKDVLQHLSNNEIAQLIPQFKKFKYCLITNDIAPHSLTSANRDISPGNHREIDLSRPPFKLDGVKILTYRCDRTKQVFYIFNT